MYTTYTDGRGELDVYFSVGGVWVVCMENIQYAPTHTSDHRYTLVRTTLPTQMVAVLKWWWYRGGVAYTHTHTHVITCVH